MEQKKTSRRLGSTAILLVLLALAAVTTAAVAWFSISSHNLVSDLDMNISAGPTLRFDLDAHETYEQYQATLSAEQIFARIAAEYGFDPTAVPLDPVTTADNDTFTLQDGSVVPQNSGKYWRFTLHFCASEDMYVHLSSDNGKTAEDGTQVTSTVAGLPQAMRVSFSAGDGTKVYCPDGGGAGTFSLPAAGQMVYNESNQLFFVKKETDTPVTVRIWLEGTDAACTNTLKGSNYAIRLRFVGTADGHTPYAE